MREYVTQVHSYDISILILIQPIMGTKKQKQLTDTIQLRNVLFFRMHVLMVLMSIIGAIVSYNIPMYFVCTGSIKTIRYPCQMVHTQTSL